MRAESAVEPTKSENITVTWRRSARSSAKAPGALVPDLGSSAAFVPASLRRAAIASSSLRRCPNDVTPSSFRSSADHGPAPRGCLAGAPRNKRMALAPASCSRSTLHMLRQACGYALAMRGTTRGRFKTGSGIARSSTRSDTPSYRRRASKNLGETSRWCGLGRADQPGFASGSPFSPAGPYGPTCQ